MVFRGKFFLRAYNLSIKSRWRDRCKYLRIRFQYGVSVYATANKVTILVSSRNGKFGGWSSEGAGPEASAAEVWGIERWQVHSPECSELPRRRQELGKVIGQVEPEVKPIVQEAGLVWDR